MNFKNKVVVITGATGGIGGTAAEEFARKGAKLSLIGTNPDKLKNLEERLNLDASRVLFIQADIRNENEVKSYVDQTIEKFGTIDIFLNNAGTEGEVANIVDTEEKNLDCVININIKGTYFGLKHVLPIMYQNKSGSIINTASVAGLMGSPGLAPYIASKHAVIGITKSAALESAPYNVRVNAICPGPVNNNMMRQIEKKAAPDAPDALKDAFVKDIPFGRYANNQDVVNTMLFLASDLSTYLTGTIHRIDGGTGAK
ncbi:MAG: SDR family NAD(P)-dependent oxidoreductase [Bacilli bacterium]|nr:SDR family NAD(P)-dependent oxidoreductase [Bacilli bacterium]